MSPTVLQSGPYRFFFFSTDRGESPHVHLARDRKIATFWLEPVRNEHDHGFAPNELNKISVLVQQHQAELLKAWHDYFKSGNGNRGGHTR